MTDNAFVYTKSVGFQALLGSIGARHILVPAYTPRWNGKVERFIGSLLTEWAYSHRWRDAHERARRCNPSSATTTDADHTAHSEANRRSAAFTTSVETTPSA